MHIWQIEPKKVLLIHLYSCDNVFLNMKSWLIIHVQNENVLNVWDETFISLNVFETSRMIVKMISKMYV